MSIKTIKRIKFFAMIIIPIIAIETVAVLEFRLQIQPEMASPIYPVLFLILAVSIFRYRRRCRECGVWNSMKEVSREEINRMEHPQTGSRANKKREKRKAYQVRTVITKKCTRCGEERLYEIIKEVKE